MHFPAISSPVRAPTVRPLHRRLAQNAANHRGALAVLSTLVALVAVQLLLTRVWLDLIDEGYFAELADRVARGDLPYRDFATVYTPGVHYLHAWTFGLLGRDLVSLRLLLVVAKACLAVVLYRLGRRLMPPAFAALPVALLFAVDTAPLMWEPHPAWYALLFALVCAWSMNRLIATGADRWSLLAGAAAGISCAFKQNIGLFILLAAAGFLLFHSSDLPAGRARVPLPRFLDARLWLAGRAGLALLLLGAITWLLRAYLDPRLALVFLVPVATLAGVGLLEAARRPAAREQREASAGRLLCLGGAFLLTTLAWLLPLAFAVGPTSVPITQFFGALDLTGFYWELAEPRLGFALLLLAAVAAPIAVQRFYRSPSHTRRLFEAAFFLLMAALAIDLALVDVALATPDSGDGPADLWYLSARAAETLLLYLPTLSFWGGMLGYTSERPGSLQEKLTLRWYLLAGSLLLFNLYPRMDTMHITYSGPLLFVVGAFALYRLYQMLESRLPALSLRFLPRAMLFGSLLVVPALAALPNLEWRISSLLRNDYVAMDTQGAGLIVPASSRDAIGGVARYLRERTAPGEPIFVYPSLPMFYYLADRPNASRFGHLYPGAATPDEQRELIDSLESSHVRYIVWDQYWVNEWASGGKSVLNRTLTDYLLDTYHTETMVGPFYILTRSE